MGLSGITGGNLELTPFKLERLVELKIIQKINHHTRLYCLGLVAGDLKDQAIADITQETRVALNQVGGDSGKTLLFMGIVAHVEVKAVQDVYYIEIEAVSLTKLLDLKLKSRSFQNENLTYAALIRQIVDEYGGDIKDCVSQQRKIGKIFLQYQATDWDTLVRLASQFNAGLIPYILADVPKLYFGVPESGNEIKLENCNYRVRKKLSDYRYSAENFIPGLQEDDFIYYEIETGQKLALGDLVIFKNAKLYVSEVTSYLENAILKHRYIITPQKGLSQNTVYNDKIVGLSLEGKVIDVAKDNVKVHLEVDAQQKADEACWFPYASVYTAEGNSGWYCMPEKNDYVRITFPSNKEEEGVAVSSVRKDAQESQTNKLGNPDTKYFRTKSGKELMFSPSEIVITGKDNEIYLRLNDQDGIEIYSNKEVKIIAREDLTLESENSTVVIKAKEGIQLSCNNSEIKMDKKSVAIKGDEVKSN